MSNSQQACVTMEEDDLLTKTSGSCSSRDHWDPHHRKLAVCSILCGFSCIGIKALINSVKAEGAETNSKKAAEFSRKARKLSIISIVSWLCFLAMIPVLMALASYLLTLVD